MSNHESIRLLFVCLGNICRSPLAEGVFRSKVQSRNLQGTIEIDSAGTGSWHVGEPPDSRMRRVAESRGVSLDGQQARQLTESDLDYYTHIFAMDKSNLHDTLYLDTHDRYGHKVRLFREFDPLPGDYQVPDPYYGGDNGFEEVFDIVDRTAEAILSRLIDTYKLEAA
ncbi:MAG: low molecular weight protein-tyrosine-phosphatase [Rhodothermales bacterium]|nr:low molecular weight protein-tyrosine-phosphatase [Rhodothermales bacterium]